ncbi:MAG: hypothetical protein H5T76_20480 [Streptomyces sp.]|nr:hypothetical protein [Streptomyces sp.]
MEGEGAERDTAGAGGGRGRGRMTRLSLRMRLRDAVDAPGAPGAPEGPGAPDGPDGQSTGDAQAVSPADEDPQPPDPADEAATTTPRPWLRHTLTALVCTALLLTGSGFLYAAHDLRSDPSAGNRALTDAEATTKVAGDVGNALARIFSYTPEGLAATERSADGVLAGRAARQYAELIDRIREDITKQGVTLSTQPVRTGVLELDGDQARLLVFLDQISRRGTDRPTSVAAQLTVTARWERDQWRIVDIRAR